MAELLAIVRKEKSYDVMRSLSKAEIPYVSWTVKGRGKEGGLRYKGVIREKVLMPFLPKRAFLVFPEEEQVEEAVNLIVESAHTGAYGDGKVFLINQEEESVMKLVKAVIRPEKVYEVIKALEKDGFRAMTMWDVVGRGKEGGIMVGDTPYDELAKTLVMVAVEDKDTDKVIESITKAAHTGAYGDGKVFACNLSKVWTIRTKVEGL
ncbi:nitrogen regulatory protein P-II family [Hydrogenivirga caldilitoris]|uniref:Nitrogen regulatory protein P-II family n=1 Tax=Hydrogenivirga caldilitoris TaxID=246264 RepID=A0A497XNM0_9AQUI|nr:P-II family nitrogen regulator [Hydrogenivirga caldilitoris]RLJ70458.1 nitrogen regulatory protein P-II family [Hydrogenivirga caldilitoris]